MKISRVLLLNALLLTAILLSLIADHAVDLHERNKALEMENAHLLNRWRRAELELVTCTIQLGVDRMAQTSTITRPRISL